MRTQKYTSIVVEFLVLTDGSQDVVWNKTLGSFVVLAGLGFFEDFFNNLLENSGHVDWSIRRDTVCITAFLEVTVDTTDWEDDASTCGSGFRFLIECHLTERGGVLLDF
ncbi:Conserved_hypothetical protein [Hexamita inflata]|uniref:Uncharacterized protein n=1 Tax=Hexamita inflata TaxID=28002 RepID=A0ABP1IJU8_9EUKA